MKNLSVPDNAKAWHQMHAAMVLRRLGVDQAAGLSEAEVQQRQAKFGPNELIERGRKSGWKILQEQLTGILIVILLLAGITSLLLGDTKDAVAVFAIVVLNTVLGFTQEFRAEKAIAALKKMAVPSVTVRRSGRTERVSGSRLVPGDILSLEAGNIVPADCRLVETRNLRVQESVLTGEPEAVEKHVDPIDRAELAVGDRRNMAYSGTFVTYGRGLAVVTEIGMQTELGRIAEMLQAVKREPTPLQRRLTGLARYLALAAIVLVGLIFLIGLVRGESLRLLVLTSISMLVAAVPEGLAAVVTITLALGTQRMLRRKALVRKLAAVETLGSVTVICSDKTGTLTENRMTVVMLDVAGHRLQVDEHLRSQKLVLESNGSKTTPVLSDSTEILLMTGATLCNDAVLRESPQQSKALQAIGDPTEAAMVVAAAHFGLRKPLLDSAFPRIHEVPFESSRKRMSTIHRIDSVKLRAIEETYPSMRFTLAAIGIGSVAKNHLAFTKGAVDGLLERCTHAWVEGHLEGLDQSYRNRIEKSHEELARTGVRVLGIAVRVLSETETHGDNDSIEQNLAFIGLIGMADPPREGVKSAIETCTNAGIRTVMITGDHPATANQIAHELEISKNGLILTGDELLRLSVEELTAMVENVPVYARVSPEHKLKIVEALQRRGHVVAMTGDGVNDAPALKKANIGVTMGIAGTDVAKEAADMVLLDDNFSTIVAAVEEGRVIYDNLRKFIKYALSGNVGEILVMLLAPLAGMPIPLLPLQILWINLVTDGLPGLALAVEPAERDTMKRHPYRLETSIFADGMAGQIIWIGLLVGIVSLVMGYWYWSNGQPEWQTIVFTTLTLSQMANALAIRSSRDSLFRIGLFSNIQLVLVVIVSCLLQAALIYVPFFQSVFATRPLSAQDLLLSCVLSSTVFWAIELQKFVARRRMTT